MPKSALQGTQSAVKHPIEAKRRCVHGVEYVDHNCLHCPILPWIAAKLALSRMAKVSRFIMSLTDSRYRISFRRPHFRKGIFSMFDPREKIALFIDGANLYATSRALGFDIDYRKLLSSFHKRGYLLRAYYYTALVEDQEYSSIRPLIDWLDYNGFKVVTKPAKEFTDSTGRRKIKGNMDIELTVDALELADVVDHYVIFSGDGDFRTLVEALQRRGRKVSIVSTMASQPPMISDDLRRQADHFIDLTTLKNEVGRDPSERPVRRPEPAEVEEDDY
jgi:uncharacterized LabA/DUF88 family protein